MLSRASRCDSNRSDVPEDADSDSEKGPVMCNLWYYLLNLGEGQQLSSLSIWENAHVQFQHHVFVFLFFFYLVA